MVVKSEYLLTTVLFSTRPSKFKMAVTFLMAVTLSVKIARRMKAAGQTPRETRRPIVGTHGVTRSGMVLERGAAVQRQPSPELAPPRINLKRPIRVGAWNVWCVSQ